MADTHFYEVSLNWTEERKGKLQAESLPDVEIATPPQFPGGHEGIWSPEHLYVASVSSCIMTTFIAIAGNSNIEFESYESKASGKMEKTEGKFSITEINVRAKVKVKQEKDIKRAERILEKSEAACLISRSIKSKVILEPEILI